MKEGRADILPIDHHIVSETRTEAADGVDQGSASKGNVRPVPTTLMINNLWW